MERAFVANGSWQKAIRREAPAVACDPAGQRKATLRVSALAALVTLGLTAGPDFRSDPALTETPRRVAVAMPEIVTAKPADRVPAAGETTSAFQRRPRSMPAEAPAGALPAAHAPDVPSHGIEIVDAATLRAGSMTVRIAGLALPASDRTCRRLDGLAVACVSRAESYLELLVRGRAVACDRAGIATDGVPLGRCRIGDTDVAEQMVRQGWAEAADRDQPALVMAEAQARRQKLGIWRD